MPELTDDDVLKLFEPGSEYTREQLGELANAYDHESSVFVSRALGRLKRWNKVAKNNSGNWYLVEGEHVAEAISEKSIAKPPKEPEQVKVIKPAAEVNESHEVDSDINTALLRVANRFNRFGEVSSLEDKLYTLEFLGKLLDPTIDKVFKSIADDLRRLNGDV